MKFLLLNLTLLAGMYCNCEYSRCAGCCKKYCGNGDNEKTDTKVNQDSSASDNNKEKSLEEDTKENEKQKALYFKIQGRAIDDNGLGCFGKYWFEEYKKEKGNNSILLYELTEQPDVQEKEVGTLVCSKGNKELQYTKGGDLPDDLKDSDDKWAIFKVTTLKEYNNEKKEGESHIFYCSDVSSFYNNGLFEEVYCWSIEILAANTQSVNNFSYMFYDTNSYLELIDNDPDKPGLIGLDKLDVSEADNLKRMFSEALYKQKTVDSLKDWILKNGAEISFMFCVDASKFVDKNAPNFRVLNGWVVGRNVYLICCLTISKYNIFFQGDDNGQNNNKLPEWYADRIK
ncbi:MAG: hypothetical protein II393_03410 [Cytophagales bacterium]|nr:hypothetical protein [Cytophagales bacterium]